MLLWTSILKKSADALRFSGAGKPEFSFFFERENICGMTRISGLSRIALQACTGND
jgi:hypothetical protein